MTIISCFQFRVAIDEKTKMNCISRRDHDKKLFTRQSNFKQRFNLYKLIDIEDGTLNCANEKYPLTEICYNEFHNQTLPPSQFCTLLGKNQIVDLEQFGYL